MRSFTRLFALALVAFAPALTSTGLASADQKPQTGPKMPTPTGKLNREEFEEALRPVLKDLNDCYQKALKKDALAEGEVVLVLAASGGKVIAADTDRDVSTMKLEDAHKCIIGVVKKMVMPLAKDDTGKHDAKLIAVVRYPVEFSLGIDVEDKDNGTAIAGAKLDAAKVKNVFFIQRLEIGRCYLDSYKANKGSAAMGKLVMKINVTGGVVSDVNESATDTTVADPGLKKCVFDAVKKFKFPSAKDAQGNDDPKAASVITYPLLFRPM